METETAVSPHDSAVTRQLQWLALSLTPGIGAGRGRRLVESFGGIDHLFAASLTALEAAGLPAAAAQSISLGKSLELAAAELGNAKELGAGVIVPGDAEYPRRLLEIYDPPLVFYLRGNAEIIDKPGIAIVGTRHPTPYGTGMAERLACDLAARGLIVFSGMARGIDTAAHRGALNAHGRTVAIWGTGIDEVYPKENQKITDQILASGGAILTEFPLGTFPAPQNFPIRNRIISGIAIGVLVLEAGEFSGTRVTARCALEQGREVFAVPGNVTNKLSWGPNTLIKQGAPCLINVLGPQESLLVTLPGTANTSRPCSSAQRAVTRVPLNSPASSTRTPMAMPLIIRLRMGKFCGAGNVPRGNSVRIAPPDARIWSVIF